MSVEKSKDLKSKLDLIWNELQTNLPSINLNDTQDNDDEDDELNFDDDDDDEVVIKNFDESLNDDFLKRFDSPSVSDAYLNETDELNLKLENFNKIKTSNLKLIANSNESAQAAAKITKNIFENTNSKLNMDIFNSINIDDLLNTVDKTPKDNKKNQKMNFSTQTTSRIVDDENILKKLSEFSSKYSKNDSMTNFQTSEKPSNVENEFKSLNKLDELITNDLQKYLKSHNLKDGNLTETRRIDLRDSQNMTPTIVRVYSKPKAEQLFAEILNENSVYPESKNSQRMKFINEGNTSSSESDDDDDQDGNDKNNLWFERYRQHRLLNSNLKKN